jgi:hypothetical protein
VDSVVANPSGSLCKAIFLIASEETSGNIAAANSGVKAIAVIFALVGSSRTGLPRTCHSIVIVPQAGRSNFYQK